VKKLFLYLSTKKNNLKLLPFLIISLDFIHEYHNAIFEFFVQARPVKFLPFNSKMFLSILNDETKYLQHTLEGYREPVFSVAFGLKFRSCVFPIVVGSFS